MNESEKRRPDLSVCMIVRDEANTLPECLKYVREFADEIIVVDTGSRDGTPEIAASYGAKVYHFTWQNDYSLARNESLKHASGKWILWLDADDRIYPDQHAKIRRLAQTEPNRGINFILQNRGVDQSRCYQLRMFPNHPQIRFERPIHEQVAPSIEQLGLPIVNSDVVLVHTGYSTPEVLKQKKLRYIRMMEEWVKDHPNDLYMQCQLAITQHTLGNHRIAADILERVLQRARERNEFTPTVKHSHILLGRCYLHLGEFNRALEVLEDAKSHSPDSRLLWLSIAEAYIWTERCEEARVLLEKQAEAFRRQLDYFPLDDTMVEYGRQVLLGKCYLELGDRTNGEKHLEEARKIRPDRPEAWKYMAQFLEKQGQLDEAIWYYQEASERENDKHYCAFKAGELYLKRNALPAAVEWFRQSLKKNPAVPQTWMNLGVALRGMGRFQDALQAFQVIAEKYPNFADVAFQIALTQFDAGEELNPPEFLSSSGDPRLNFLQFVAGELPRTEAGEQFSFAEVDRLQRKWRSLQDKISQLRRDRYGLELVLMVEFHLVTDARKKKSILFRLAQVQEENHRVIQAIASLEKVILFCRTPAEAVPVLEKIRGLYSVLELTQHVALIDQQLRQLTSAVV
jgi:glycosyltransferase involved in cell wall biosynthesis